MSTTPPSKETAPPESSARENGQKAPATAAKREGSSPATQPRSTTSAPAPSPPQAADHAANSPTTPPKRKTPPPATAPASGEQQPAPTAPDAPPTPSEASDSVPEEPKSGIIPAFQRLWLRARRFIGVGRSPKDPAAETPTPTGEELPKAEGSTSRALATRSNDGPTDKVVVPQLSPARAKETQSPAVRRPTHLELGALGTGRRPGFIRRHLLFLLVVALPTLLAAFYFIFLASDIYVSESSFVVRTPNQKQSGGGGLGAALLGAGLGGVSQAQDDVYTVSQYIMSRDALQLLDDQINLRDSWGSREIDFIRRFDAMGWNNTREALFEYYPRRISVDVDPSAGITTLAVNDFSPEQATQINEILLGEAENLVNMLNTRARNDLIRFAENEVNLAEEKAKDAALAVSVYRNTQSVVDPERQTELHFQHISRLQEELMRTESQLTQLRVFAPDSPHPPALELRAVTLRNEIDKEMAKITGGENSLASLAAAYERLALEREFADQQLASALASLEVARNEAQRQQLYLETISRPNLADGPLYPRRARGILSTFVLGLVAWGILGMLLAGVREHQQ